ncbi:MAG: hypothetical protein F9K43_21645 [Bauldia sp.]|nr:MAG: hypothetical protein F9K43_21645 [Bauldia sp.]MBZ0229113.1 hypothetical protein [Bauldia sp.]
MQIESAGYNEDGTIRAVINGAVYSVPDDLANRDRRAIADWEAAGGVIAPYVAPVERRLVPKYVIVDRLQATGLLDAAYVALDAQDRYTRERWNTRTAIYADDQTAVALLAAIGADPVAILAP